MNDLAQNLIEELQCETVFTIPILGGIPVSEAVVVTWIIMAVVVLLCVILPRHPTTRRICCSRPLSRNSPAR